MDIWSIFKVLLILSFLAGLMYLTLFLLKKYFYQTGGKSSKYANINVISVQMIMPKKFIAIVRIQDKTLALGISDHSINVLSELENIPMEENIGSRHLEGGNFPNTFFEQFKKNLGMK